MGEENTWNVRNAVIVKAEIHLDVTYTTVEIILGYGSGGNQSASFHSLTAHLVKKLMEVGGVDTWSALPGRVVRTRFSILEPTVEAIGHAIEDDWLDLSGAMGSYLKAVEPKMAGAQVEEVG
jgi:hypothetical protein